MNSLFIPILLSGFAQFHGVKVKTDTGYQKIDIPVKYSFNSIKIYSDIVVFITEGEINKITALDEEVAHSIKFKVEDGVLILRGKNSLFNQKNQQRIMITVKDIHCITIMDDAEVRIVGELTDQQLKLEIFGDGAIYANTKATDVTTFIKGLGKIEVTGNFKNTTVNKDVYGNTVTTYKYY